MVFALPLSFFARAKAEADSNHVFSCTVHANFAGNAQQVAGGLIS